MTLAALFFLQYPQEIIDNFATQGIACTMLILAAMLLHGIGYGLFSSPNTILITTSVSEEETSNASASLSAMRLIGQTVSLGILTSIFAIIMGNVAIEAQYYGLLLQSSNIISVLAVIFVVFGAVFSFLGLKGVEN